MLTIAGGIILAFVVIRCWPALVWLAVLAVFALWGYVNVWARQSMPWTWSDAIGIAAALGFAVVALRVSRADRRRAYDARERARLERAVSVPTSSSFHDSAPDDD